MAQKKSLKGQLDSALAGQPQHLKFYISCETLDKAFIYHRNANMLVPSASVIKVPLMLEVFAQSEEGRFSLKDKYKIQTDDLTEGSGLINQNAVGKEFTIMELVQEMIRVSDNTATNILIKKVGLEATTKRMERWGFKQLHLKRLMMDTMAVRQGRQNFVSTREISILLRRLESGELTDKKDTNTMLNILKRCEDRNMIPRLIPHEIAIAHKTGGLPYIQGDVALVFSATPFVLSVFVEGFQTETEAHIAISQIAQLCYEKLN